MTTIFCTRWSENLLSLFDETRRKHILYMGYVDKSIALKIRKELLDQGLALPYDRQLDKGITPPRKCKRLVEYPAVLEWHRPNLDWLDWQIHLNFSFCQGKEQNRAKFLAARKELGLD